MKATKLAAMGLIATGILSSIGGVTSFAEEASKSIKTEGTIELVEDGGDSNVVDPGKVPPGVVEPPIIVPPLTAGEASLVWYPKFNFGTHKYDLTKGGKYDAIIKEADYFSTTNESGEVEKVPFPSFVQVKHTPLANSWDLGVSLGDFIEKGTEGGVGKTLKGAKIKFTGMRLVNNIGDTAELPKDKENGNPNSSLELVPKSGTKNLLFYKASETSSDGISINSLIFGEVKDDTSNDPSLVKEGTGEDSKYVADKSVKYNEGVTLELPPGLSVAKNGYTADLEWTLSATF